MRFPVYFKRRKGTGDNAIPAIGTDSDPAFNDPPKKTGDNVLSHKLSRPMKRVAVGYRYEGSGSIVTLPCKLWVWDDNSDQWYLAASGTLTNGQITYLRCPSLADPPQTGSLQVPQHGIEAMLVVADNSSGDGTLHFVMGPDTANY